MTKQTTVVVIGSLRVKRSFELVRQSQDQPANLDSIGLDEVFFSAENCYYFSYFLHENIS